MEYVYCLLNVCYMFRRSLRHPQGELLSLLNTICLLLGGYNGWVSERGMYHMCFFFKVVYIIKTMLGRYGLKVFFMLKTFV